jgi:hypothetical protein
MSGEKWMKDTLQALLMTLAAGFPVKYPKEQYHGDR